MKNKKVYFDESIGVEYELSEDEIYIDKTERLIQYIILDTIGISLTAFVSLLFWIDTVERIIIKYVQ